MAQPRWQPRLPLAALGTFAGASGALAWLVGGGQWPWQATGLLVVAGAAHGTGFDVLVHRGAAAVATRQAASFSGTLATVNQLAIITGIAVAGTVYQTSGMRAVLLALTAIMLITTVLLRQLEPLRPTR